MKKTSGSKTSVSHPIHVDIVSPRCDSATRIGMTFCPGKVQAFAQSGHWERDLILDLERLQTRFNISRLVCCLEEHEKKHLQVENLQAACLDRGIELLSLPIPDGGVPSKQTVMALHAFSREALQNDSPHGFTAVFCKGGLGRTGLVTACFLQDLGVSPRQSIQLVRAARKGAIENVIQEKFVLSYSSQ